MSEKLPEAPAPGALRGRLDPDTVVLPAGTRLWRVYFRGGSHPTAWNRFRTFGPVASARFDHHLTPAGEQDRAILYAAMGTDPITTCVAEAFQEDRTVDRSLREPWLVRFSADQDIPLLSLRGRWPTRAGTSMNINSTADRRVTRGWSRSIYEAYPEVWGVCYASSMNANAPAVALYERAIGALPPRPDFHRPLSDPSLEDVLKRICRQLGYDYL